MDRYLSVVIRIRSLILVGKRLAENGEETWEEGIEKEKGVKQKWCRLEDGARQGEQHKGDKEWLSFPRL